MKTIIATAALALALIVGAPAANADTRVIPSAHPVSTTVTRGHLSTFGPVSRKFTRVKCRVGSSFVWRGRTVSVIVCGPFRHRHHR